MNDLYAILDQHGIPVQAIQTLQPAAGYVLAPPGLQTPADLFRFGFYFSDNGWESAGPKPSQHHRLDAASKEWVLDTAPAKRQLAQAVDRLRDQKHASPIAVGATLFDADAQSVENIRGLIARIERGDGLTTGWLGWRVFDNTMVWADWTAPQVLQGLYDVACALEDRKQSLLAAAWAHKAAIQGLETLEEVQGYDVSTGWPS